MAVLCVQNSCSGVQTCCPQCSKVVLCVQKVLQGRYVGEECEAGGVVREVPGVHDATGCRAGAGGGCTGT